MISRIYAITPDTTPNIIQIASIIKKYNIRILQYRRKVNCFNTKLLEAKEVLKLCQKLGVWLIINDDIKLAQTIGAHGVHLGKNDNSIIYARHKLGNKAIIGMSCYNDISLAKKAQQLGVSYCALGSIFPSKTKPYTPHCSLKIITQARRQLTIPIVAIGGINFDNCDEVFQAGANSVAMVSALKI